MSSNLDLNLGARTALVCGSSAGLGKACAIALARAGVAVTINGRTPEKLENAAREIAVHTGARVVPVVADVSSSEGRKLLLTACPAPDILVNNAAGPPPGQFADWGEEEWSAALRQNMIAPILLMRAVVGPMIERRWGRIVNITSSATKAPLPLLGLSNGARSGLTGFVAGFAREIAEHGVTVNNMLPGNFATDRLKSYVASLAQRRETSFEELWEKMQWENPSRRFGDPSEFGTICAFLASDHAAYITGQNILLDGGAYPGVF